VARDGRVLLDSYSTDLVPGSSPGTDSQLYLYSPATGTYRLITARAGQPTVGTAGALQEVGFDGQLTQVVFASTRTDLVPGLSPGPAPHELQIFRCDLAGAGCSLISAAHGGPLAVADEPCSELVAAADSGTVAFGSRATNLTAWGPSGSWSQAYLWSPGSGVELISRSADVINAAANGETTVIDLSANGRFVLVSSRATDLVPGLVDLNNAWDAFVFDAATDTWELVSASVASPGLPANAGSYAVAISADGRHALFYSDATDLVAGQADSPPLNAAFAASDLFVLDRNTGVVRLVSHLPGKPLETAGFSYYGQISEDGTRVGFMSTSPQLLPGSTGEIYGTYLWDGAGGEVQPLYEGKAGPAFWPGAWPIFNATRYFDGSILPFLSFGDDILPRGDSNGYGDAYVMKLDGLFRDGFESGGTGAWSSTVP
jgi:hypothetical protein